MADEEAVSHLFIPFFLNLSYFFVLFLSENRPSCELIFKLEEKNVSNFLGEKFKELFSVVILSRR